MSISTHALCDWCETRVFGKDEDQLLEEGWLTVSVGDEKFDFDSLPCLLGWAGSVQAREFVESAMCGREDDDDGDE